MRGPWFGFNKVVDSDTTNFKDLVDEIVDKFSCGYGEFLCAHIHDYSTYNLAEYAWQN